MDDSTPPLRPLAVTTDPRGPRPGKGSMYTSGEGGGCVLEVELEDLEEPLASAEPSTMGRPVGGAEGSMTVGAMAALHRMWAQGASLAWSILARLEALEAGVADGQGGSGGWSDSINRGDGNGWGDSNWDSGGGWGDNNRVMGLAGATYGSGRLGIRCGHS
eukprot:Sspe_Gene.87946::Locus_60029_Transcript_1_1_Confidence_1.000_Length_944::g.87946::m.87946